MIKNFINKQLEDLFFDGTRKGIKAQHVSKLMRMTDRLDKARKVLDMDYPGSGLHKLEPKKDNRWAVKVDKNWRLTFLFKDGDAYEVNYEDYH